jgi:uncharacterized Zn-finger protein
MQDWLARYKSLKSAPGELTINSWQIASVVCCSRGAGASSRRGGPSYQARHRLTEAVVPHFHNTPGVPVIEIGAREFMCIGELPPFDHPHVFLDMGDATEIICPYCSTLFRYDPSLGPHAGRPTECMLPEDVTV